MSLIGVISFTNSQNKKDKENEQVNQVTNLNVILATQVNVDYTATFNKKSEGYSAVVSNNVDNIQANVGFTATFNKKDEGYSAVVSNNIDNTQANVDNRATFNKKDEGNELNTEGAKENINLRYHINNHEIVIANPKHIKLNRLNIYDISGRKVLTYNINKNDSNYTKTIKTLSNGNYIVELIFNGNMKKSIKLVR